MVDMAVKQRRCVSKEYKDEERERLEQRKQNMMKENAKRVALKEKNVPGERKVTTVTSYYNIRRTTRRGAYDRQGKY